MPEETNGSGNPSRLDRIERIVEVLANVSSDLRQDVKVLPTAPVVLGDQMKQAFDKLAIRMEELAEEQKRTEESLRHTDAHMDALILTVDEIVRGRKQM